MLGEVSVLSSFAPPLHKAKYFLFFPQALNLQEKGNRAVWQLQTFMSIW